MYKVLVFAGTTEGYEITQYLERHQVSVHMCAATEYGSQRLQESEYLTVSHERMTAEQMEGFMEKEQFTVVVDATHPYAVEVTKNIRRACENTKREYVRILRQESMTGISGDVICVDSIEEAVVYLSGTEGKVLVTTGSKELHKFTALPEYQERIYARVLSLPDVAAHCSDLGFKGAHLICMQGPFTREMNTAMLKQYGCTYLVTKESGNNGGFQEKCDAAREAGASLVVIGRPVKEEGMTLGEGKQYLQKRCGFTARREITLVGIGMGSSGTFTEDGKNACRQADLIIGAKRLVDAAALSGQKVHYEYAADKIKEYIEAHPQYEHIVIALSGDVGFYSGARKLIQVLGEDVKVICGISSLVYFMARIQLSWQDAAIVSAHGKYCNLLHYAKTKEKTFAILGTEDAVGNLAEKLVHYGLDHIMLHVGENLSYPDEKIVSGKPADFVGYRGSSLSVLCMENPKAKEHRMHLKDTDFLRGKVPMTKEEVRSLSVDKLQLVHDSVCYDVGAGTGSVSMEMALQAYDGRIYAIEKKKEAVDLIKENQKHLGLDNLEVIEGLAPGAMEGLEAPSHAFIGGSSGNLKEIIELLLGKNPTVRIVINCIALETVAEALACVKSLPLRDVDITQVSVSKSRELGAYHMMMGENPIYIISCKGGV